MTRLRPGRPLDEARTPAILEAAMAVVAEVGVAGLTIERVARHAGVGKATIYRRWSTKEALLLDAWTKAVPLPQVPDTGDLRADLVGLFTATDRGAKHDLTRIFPQMVAAAKVNDEVGEAYRSFVHERRQPVKSVIELAIGRGDLPADLDRELAVDLLVSPLIYRWIIAEVATDPGTIERMIDIVVAGLAQDVPAAR